MMARRSDHPRVSPDTAIWVTKDGRTVQIAEMTHAHLRNTLAYLWRKVKDKWKDGAPDAPLRDLAHHRGRKNLGFLSAEIDEMSDASQDAITAEIWDLDDLVSSQDLVRITLLVYPVLKQLASEAVKRGYDMRDVPIDALSRGGRE